MYLMAEAVAQFLWITGDFPGMDATTFAKSG
jgi:hypothetical protein